jgi:uncharacterized membrane-anchored protein
MSQAAASHRRTGRVFATAKVPEITALFWVIKILTTGMGEAASDYLAFTSLVLAGVVGAGGLALALAWQFRTTRYQTWPYWTAVAMVAVTGTMGADFLHRFLGISYFITTPFCGLVLAVVLAWWWHSERTLSIHSITTRRRELFYWATVMASFAFGTAAGDLTAASLHLGYFKSGVLFGILILVPLVAWRLGLNAVTAFWAAYILTRPLGASFADWLAKPPSRSGLGYGDGPVTLVLLALIVVLVAWVAVRERGQLPAADVDGSRSPAVPPVAYDHPRD